MMLGKRFSREQRVFRWLWCDCVHCVQSERSCTAQEKQRAVCDVFLSAGVNLLVGTESGLMLLDRSGQGKVYNLITRRRFQQMEVLEGLNVLVTISGLSQYKKI